MNKLIRSGLVAAVFFITAFAYSLLYSHQAGAVSLPLVSADVKAPLGSALTPVTDMTNPITTSLPVAARVQSTPDTLSANAELPVLSTNPDTAPGVNINIPASEVVQSVSRSTNLPIVVASSPSPDENGTLAVANTDSMDSTDTATNSGTSSDTSDKKDDKPKQPLLGKIATFFESTLPSALHNLASGIAGKEVSTLPIIISLILFLLTLGAVGGIIYASNHGGIVALGRIGNINLTKIAETHDVAQISSFIVATVCFGVVAIFLALTTL